jgi:hypothetical protein
VASIPKTKINRIHDGRRVDTSNVGNELAAGTIPFAFGCSDRCGNRMDRHGICSRPTSCVLAMPVLWQVVLWVAAIPSPEMPELSTFALTYPIRRVAHPLRRL